MNKTWSDDAVRGLQAWGKCPRCDLAQVHEGICTHCRADLRNETAVELADASKAAVAALEHRQSILDRIPTAALPHDVAVSAPAVSGAATPTPTPTSSSRSTISVQSVLAVAGAGLFAVAAIVFTFFNPDLTDTGTRTTAIAIITLVFITAAWLLARANLQFSAEAVGALGMVFVILDIWAIATQTPAPLGGYGAAAIATLLISGLFVILATVRRMRAWLWVGLVGIAITPALVGYAIDTPWSVVLGHLGVGFAALLVQELAQTLGRRFESTLRVDHASATGLQMLSLIVVLSTVIGLPSGDTRAWILGISAVIAGLAVMAVLSTRNALPQLWSLVAGVLVAVSLTILPFAAVVDDPERLLALLPAVAVGGLALLATASRAAFAPRVDRIALLTGVAIVVVLASIPTALVVLGQAFTAPARLVPSLLGGAATLGMLALAVGLVIAAIARKIRSLGLLALAVALAGLVGFATWSELSDVTRVALALGAGVALSVVTVALRRASGETTGVTRATFVFAHVLIVLGAIMTTPDRVLVVVGGLGVVAAIGVLTGAVRRSIQPLHAAAGFVYALGVFAFFLAEFTVLSWPPTVIGLTATLGLVVAIVLTVLRAVPVRFWAAALVVAAIPFALSIGMLFSEISGWVGLSAATAFVLALVLVVIHRPGARPVVRVGAAGLLVPTVTVVIISVVPQFVEQSTSPFTLPITATLVALVLPTTEFVGRSLRKLGHTEAETRGVRLALEVSALITGALAVVLTLVRTATDFGTTFLVLGIIGIGAVATGQFLKRRYAWIVAYFSFTGALWSLLALNEIALLDAYVLPPALVAALIGLVAVWRGRRGLGLYAGGLAVAVAAPLLVLIVAGNGPAEDSIEWRTIAIILASASLLLAGSLLALIPDPSRHASLRRLRVTTILVGLGASSAGLVQAIRYGAGADDAQLADPQAVMIPVLIFGLVATVLAAAAATMLVSSPRLARSRLLALPALAYFVLAPVSAFRHGPVFPITLLLVMVIVLGFMIVSALRARHRLTSLPPVWLTFLFATIAGIAGWSEHSIFRVEPFSLTLGAALLAVGIIGWRNIGETKPTLYSWPQGQRGSWRLLAPGILVMLGTSVLSTGTDPQTWRAILVIGLALVSILLGNRLQLAAPFVLGIVTLAVENVVVFAAQIGTTIDAATWWITLASAGAVLLVLAVSTERRSSGERGVAARMRDLR
ncbi:SCO7613 C-terminal domain-containing membrane protein [Salinibacterium sp. M195]|uniref:SCO7613 C-terminal domain-containing membrane protein n=1 Tax=Salinibacterium sp. M195 TaxID=2583374 RepID=UPI001C63439C|nr:hypothetical protein [Salinibacterium sp. M195]QYH34502.1 hypothetical protein FFT87_00145 [Salinibacterium sp. M195]